MATPWRDPAAGVIVRRCRVAQGDLELRDHGVQDCARHGLMKAIAKQAARAASASVAHGVAQCGQCVPQRLDVGAVGGAIVAADGESVAAERSDDKEVAA